MLRITKLTDYATILMAHLARTPERQVSAQQIGQEVDLPTPTVAKLLKQLSQAGLVQSSRGVGGGYCLARSPAEIRISELIEAIEGPVALTECALGVNNCIRSADCSTRANWQIVSRAVRVALDAVSLADLSAATPRVTRLRLLARS